MYEQKNGSDQWQMFTSFVWCLQRGGGDRPQERWRLDPADVCLLHRPRPHRQPAHRCWLQREHEEPAGPGAAHAGGKLWQWDCRSHAAQGECWLGWDWERKSHCLDWREIEKEGGRERELLLGLGWRLRLRGRDRQTDRERRVTAWIGMEVKRERDRQTDRKSHCLDWGRGWDRHWDRERVTAWTGVEVATEREGGREWDRERVTAWTGMEVETEREGGRERDRERVTAWTGVEVEREREREREIDWLIKLYFSTVKILAQRPTHIAPIATGGAGGVTTLTGGEVWEEERHTHTHTWERERDTHTHRVTALTGVEVERESSHTQTQKLYITRIVV